MKSISALANSADRATRSNDVGGASCCSIGSLLRGASDPDAAIDKLASRKIKFQRAKLLDPAHNSVASLEPHLLFFGHADDHPGGRSGENDVARLQREQPGSVGNDPLRIEDELRGM